MVRRRLGQSDLSVAPLSFGGNVFGWTADEPTSFAILDAYVNGGGNFIDTADSYSVGQSERILGRWMSERKNRDRLIIATKVGSQMGTDVNARGLSRQHILNEVDASLKRLQTEYIDLYQAHRDDPQTPLEETLATFNDLIQQGKVRSIGASNYSAARLREALQISEQYHYARYECVQPPYHLLNRAQYERELEPLCLTQGLGVITYSSLASGFLTGKYRQGQDVPSSPRAKRIQEQYMNEHAFRVLQEVDRIAQARQATDAQVAIAWFLARPGITAAIASATSIEQVRELLGSLELHLTQDEIQALDRVSAERPD